MIKLRKITLFLLFSLLLAACNSTSIPSESPAAEQTSLVPTDTVQPTEALPPTAAPPTETEPPAEVDFTANSCTLQTLLEEPDEEEASRFPAVSELDNQVGPADAAVTIVEYGDFQ